MKLNILGAAIEAVGLVLLLSILFLSMISGARGDIVHEEDIVQEDIVDAEIIQDPVKLEPPSYEDIIFAEEIPVSVESKPEKELPKAEEYVPAREDVEAIARTLWGECRGIPSDMEKAAVAWCILNRLDDGRFGDTVLEVVSAPYQFTGYKPTHPLWDDLVALAEDVLIRWHREKSGETDVGRAIPSDYMWFFGDGEHNWFMNEYRGTEYWDWSAEDVYATQE